MDLLSSVDLVLPHLPTDSEHVFHQFVIRHPQRDALRSYLQEQGVGTLVHYPVPIHLQPAYANLRPAEGSLRWSELCARQVLSLPLYPELTEDEVRRVCQYILDFCG